MADELFKQQQKQQVPIQVTREENKLTFSGEMQIDQQKLQEEQGQQVAERQMTAASSQIMNSEKFSQTDGTNPADPPMDFTDEQIREWYDRKKAAQVESRL